MTVPFGVRPRRRFQGFEPQIDTTGVDRALAFADETDQIDQMVMGQPKATPRGFWAKLAAVAPDAIASSFASNLDPNGGVLERFLGGVGRGFMQTRGNQQAQAEQQRAQELEAYKLKSDAYDRNESRRRFDITSRQPTSDYDRYKADPDGYSAYKAAGFRPPVPGQQYDLRQAADGSWTYIPRPGTQGTGPIDTGVIAPPPAPQVVVTPEGFASVSKPRDGAPVVTPIPGADGNQLQPQVPETANNAVRSNNALITQIDSAIDLLRRHGSATGLVNKGIRAIPFAGPGLLAKRGTAGDDSTRVALNAVNVGTVHEMFGGALTPTEVSRTDYAPDLGFDAEANIRRLEGLKQKAVSANQTIQGQHPGAKAVNTGGTAKPKSKKLTFDQYYKLIDNGYEDAELEAAGYKLPE